MILLPRKLIGIGRAISIGRRARRTRANKTTYKVLFKKRHSRCRKLNKTNCKKEKRCKLTKRTKNTKPYCRPCRNRSLLGKQRNIFI